MESFGSLILKNTDEIVERWYEAFRKLDKPHLDLSEKGVKNSLAVQLKVIGKELKDLENAENPKEMWMVTERLHPELRVSQDIQIEEVVQEYGLLVDVMRDLIQELKVNFSFEEYSYFYRTIFELIAESIKRYTSFQVEKVAKERSEYLAGLTHQMRTPLSALYSQIEILSEWGKIDDAALALLKRNAKRLLLLVNGVMRLERFKPEELPVHPEIIYPSRLIDEVAADNEVEAIHKGLRFEIAANRTLRISADPDLLMDALGNLVQNAVKYTSSGFIRVEVEEEEGSILVRVKDSGPGISVERQKELFKPILPGKAGGVGIGLSIVQRAVTALGGTLGMTSELGKGSDFWFRLPRGADPKAD